MIGALQPAVQQTLPPLVLSYLPNTADDNNSKHTKQTINSPSASDDENRI